MPKDAELPAFDHPRYKRDRATLGAISFGPQWTWSNGAAWSYTNWAAGMPDGQGPQCVEMWTTGEWNDVPCEQGPRAYICQVCMHTSARWRGGAVCMHAVYARCTRGAYAVHMLRAYSRTRSAHAILHVAGAGAAALRRGVTSTCTMHPRV